MMAEHTQLGHRSINDNQQNWLKSAQHQLTTNDERRRINIPGFSVNGQGDGPKNTQETARRHRYKFETFGPLNSILLYSHKAQRPTPEIDRVTMHHGQDEVYFPGKNRWQPIDISFYEAAQGNDLVASAIYKWWSASVIDIQGSTVSAQFRQKATLLLINGDGDSLWRYEMLNCWPINVVPDQLDYGDNGVAEITFKLVMDKAKESE
jgi:T4-like virus tail tube protein gp19